MFGAMGPIKLMSIYGETQIKDFYRKDAFKSVLVKINYNQLYDKIFEIKYTR